MYRIMPHPMNNNVALAKHENGEEVAGSGHINKKKGDIVLKVRLRKSFSPKNGRKPKENFVALLKDVPLDFITV